MSTDTMTAAATHGSFTIERHFKAVSLATVELSPQANGTKMLFTEHAIFLNGFEDPDAEGRKTGTMALLEQMAASLE